MVEPPGRIRILILPAGGRSARIPGGRSVSRCAGGRGGRRGAVAGGHVEAQPLALEEEPFPGDVQALGGCFEVAALLEGTGNHQALEVVDGGLERLIRADEDLVWFGRYRRSDGRPSFLDDFCASPSGVMS